jgi:hypothetical protein
LKPTINTSKAEKSKRIAVVVSNRTISRRTGKPVGFWWSELTHPYYVFLESGYHVDLYSPDGGRLQADKWRDPADASRYSPNDLISLGFINSPRHMALVENSLPTTKLDVRRYDAILLVGGLAPMYTFYEDLRVSPLGCRIFAGRQDHRAPLPRHMRSPPGPLQWKVVGGKQDLDRVREFRRALHRTRGGHADSTFLDRGGSAEAQGIQFYHLRQV